MRLLRRGKGDEPGVEKSCPFARQSAAKHGKSGAIR